MSEEEAKLIRRLIHEELSGLAALTVAAKAKKRGKK